MAELIVRKPNDVSTIAPYRCTKGLTGLLPPLELRPESRWSVATRQGARGRNFAERGPAANQVAAVWGLTDRDPALRHRSAAGVFRRGTAGLRAQPRCGGLPDRWAVPRCPLVFSNCIGWATGARNRQASTQPGSAPRGRELVSPAWPLSGVGGPSLHLQSGVRATTAPNGGTMGPGAGGYTTVRGVSRLMHDKVSGHGDLARPCSAPLCILTKQAGIRRRPTVG